MSYSISIAAVDQSSDQLVKSFLITISNKNDPTTGIYYTPKDEIPSHFEVAADDSMIGLFYVADSDIVQHYRSDQNGKICI